MPPRDVLASFPWGSLSWLLVNEGEAADLLEVLGGKASGEGPEGMLTGLQAAESLRGVGLVVTCGADGVVAAVPGGEVVKSGAGELKGKVVDTTGAGDCFTVSHLYPKHKQRWFCANVRLSFDSQGYFATLLAQTAPSATPSAAELQAVLAVACQAAAICVEAEGAMESVPVISQVRERMADKWPAGEAWVALGK